MYKKISILFLVVIAVNFTMIFYSYADNTNNVKDYLNYLTEQEARNLQKNINSIRSNHGLDVVIVITDNTEGKRSRDFADDYYDYNGYGVGSRHSGLLMLINMEIREVWISTTGKAIDIFTDRRISYMLDNITHQLSKGNYYEACNVFIDDVINYTEGQSYSKRVSNMAKSFPVYIVALVISVALTFYVSRTSKGKTTTSFMTYEETNSFALTQRKDDYIRESTVRTRIHSESSGGGSSTHRGSSGRMHGGGGRKF
ncbi:UNVERIFIED_CONTAM: uncharacterized protein Cloal_3257 [Acetivibrio alkalicellulosi]